MDTARFHFLAWKRLSKELGIKGFTEDKNEQLKGISRMASLDIILRLDNLECEPAEKKVLAARKNSWYLEYLETLSGDDLLPGAIPLLEEISAAGMKIGLGSASENAGMILDKVGIGHFFNAVVDRNKTVNSKPHPEVFLKCAAELDAAPENCVVFEDAQAGIDAAKAAGMSVIAVGSAEILHGGDRTIADLSGISLAFLNHIYQD